VTETREITTGSETFGRNEHRAERPTLTVGKAFVVGSLDSFPLRPCSRCGGCGRYSYCTMYQDRCFGCSGQGLQGYNKVTVTAMGEWSALVRQTKRPVVAGLAVGDRVVSDFTDRKTAENRWATVVSVEVTDEECGWSQVGDRERVYSYRHVVTLDTGESAKLNGNQVIRRASEGLDATPYVERAWASLPKYVQAARQSLLTAVPC
jgi:hypothetical protein